MRARSSRDGIGKQRDESSNPALPQTADDQVGERHPEEEADQHVRDQTERCDADEAESRQHRHPDDHEPILADG